MNDDWLVPDDWSDKQIELFDSAFELQPSAYDDDYLLSLFDTALFSFDELTEQERAEALEELRDYVYDEYGYEFDDYFDWDDYRDWYASV